MLRGLELLNRIICVVLIYDIFGTCKMRLKDSCILTENYRAKKVACSISCKYGVVLQRLVRQAKNAYIMLFLFSCWLAAYNNKTNSFSFEVKEAYFLLSSFVEVLWDVNLLCRFEATAIPQRPCNDIFDFRNKSRHWLSETLK